MEPDVHMETAEREKPACDVCARLRTKTAFGNFIGNEAEWYEGESSTAVYWCLKTMSAAGPDDHFAHPHLCKAGRSCFKSRDE